MNEMFVLAYVCDPFLSWKDAEGLAIELDNEALEQFVFSVLENQEV